MTSGLVAQRQQTAFTTPANGDSGDATVVLSNDNATRSTYNGHDADATIHVQLSTLASRPAASTANRVWVSNDGLKIYVDSGSAWQEIAYVSLTGGGTINTGSTTNALIVVTTGAVNSSFRYDSSNRLDIGLNSVGMSTFTLNGTRASLIVAGTATVVSGSPPYAIVDISGTITASDAAGTGLKGLFVEPTISFDSNSQTGWGVHILPTFTRNSHTSVTAVGLQVDAFTATSFTTAYGLFVSEPTGATTNIAAQFAGIVVTAASSTARSGIRFPSGTAPTSPVAGDWWFDGSNLKFYTGAATKTITWS